MLCVELAIQTLPIIIIFVTLIYFCVPHFLFDYRIFVLRTFCRHTFTASPAQIFLTHLPNLPFCSFSCTHYTTPQTVCQDKTSISFLDFHRGWLSKFHLASGVDIQISILKFNFQPRFWFCFSFSYRDGYPIWWGVLRF